MKYYATIDDHTYEIVIEQGGRILVDGVEYQVDIKAIGGRQLYSLLLNHASYEVVLDPDTDQRNMYDILVGGQRYLVKVQDERARRLSLADRNLKPPEGELVVKAPIPGLIVKVLVTSGQEVAEGEPLLILEAMKMENELRAPRRGIVHEVRVGARMQVAQGQPLITLR
ncbi:MAG: biotin/lipoyl-containing protein [Anaerolineae bacterium]